MKHITCIEDLRQLHMRKVPKAFFDYADRGSYAEETLRANREDLQQIKFRQRILVDISTARSLDHHPRREGEPAADPGAGRLDRHAIRRRRNSRLPRRAGRRHSLHAEHDVDLLDRGRRRQCRQAVLVSALRHEGSRLLQGADRARHRRQVQRAGADRRPAGDRAAPCRHQERPVGAAEIAQSEEHRRLRHQAGLGGRHPARQAPQLRQYRRPSAGRRRISPRCRAGSPRSSTPR